MKALLLSIVLIMSVGLYAANDTIGSDVLIEDQLFFGFDGKNNRIARGAVMNEGFSLEDLLTTVSFDSFFAVTGNISLNQGQLFLTKNLKLGNLSRLLTNGRFEGQGHAIEFPCRKKFTFSSPTCLRSWTQIDLVDIGDDVFSVDWSFDGKWLAVGRDANAGSELYIYSFDGTSITLATSVALGNDANSVRWHPHDFVVSVGKQNGGGDDVLIYRFNPTLSTLTLTDSVEISRNARAVAWHPQGTFLAVGQNGQNDEVRVFPFDSNTDLLGSQVSVNLIPSRAVQRNALDWDPTGSYIVAGLSDNGTAPQVMILYFDGVSLTVTQSIFIAGGQDAESIDWSPCGTYIAAGFDAGTERLRIYEFITRTGALQELTQARVGENTDDVQGLHWSHDGSCLALARDGNTGTEIRTYFFDKSTQNLTLINELDVGGGGGNDVNAIRWSPNDRFFATGDDANDIRIFAVDGDGTYRFHDTNLCFNCDVCIATNLEFEGSSIFNARGNVCDFSENATIFVNANSQLCMRNVHLRSVGEGHGAIVLRDASSQLRLSNVSVELVYDVTTTTGSIYVDGPGTWYVKDFDWFFDNTATLSVDATRLWKDSVGIALDQTGEIAAQGGGLIDTLNSGTIGCHVGVSQIATTTLSVDAVVDIPHQGVDTYLHAPLDSDFLSGPSQDKTMTDNMYLAPNRRLRVSQDSLLSGSAHYLHFAQTDEPLLLVESGVTLSLHDIVLKNFSARHVSYGDASSRVLFGPGVVIELGESQTLEASVGGVPDTPITWTFQSGGSSGSALIKGFGHCLSLPSNAPVGIVIDTHATLTVHQLRLEGLGHQPHNVRALHQSSRLVIKESSFWLDGNYSFSQGRIDVAGSFWLGGEHTFAYQSPRTSWLRAGAYMTVDHGTTFSYDAQPDGALGDDAKRKWRFEDRSATMHLCGASLHATHTGLLLDAGTLRIEHDCRFTSEAATSAEEVVLVLDEINTQPLHIDVCASANFVLDGLFSTR